MRKRAFLPLLLAVIFLSIIACACGKTEPESSPHRHMVYTEEYGAIPDSMIAYARERSTPEAVDEYLQELYAGYQTRFLQNDFFVDNELFKFMEAFDIPCEAAANLLDNLYSKEEFEVLCKNEQAELNRAFVHRNYACVSDQDGEIYSLDAISRMECAEIEQKLLCKDEILALIECNSEGIYSSDGSGRLIVSPDELEDLRERICQANGE